MNRCVSFCLAAILGVVVHANVASATILTFDASDSTLDTNVFPNGYPEGYGYATIFEGFNPLSGYGSNVTGSTGAHTNGTTTFSYGEGGEGYTPNVTVGYGPFNLFVPNGSPQYWRLGYGDLENVLYQAYESPFLEIDLLADAAHDVLLYGFDLGGYQADFTIQAVTVFDGFPNALFTPTNQIVEYFNVNVPGNSHTSFTFNTPLRANQLFIRISTSGPLGVDQSDLIGIDNIRFGQDLRASAVPEPSSLALLASLGSLGALGAWKRRRVA